MKNKNGFSVVGLTAIAIAASLTLAACGGGGGGGSSSTGSTNSAPTPSPGSSNAATPATSVPAATYTAGSAQLAMFTAINNLRGALGVGLLAQDPVLDVAAGYHAQYEADNQVVTHIETSGQPGYYGATPLSRAQLAGAPTTEWIGEVAAGTYDTPAQTAGTACFNQWYLSVYHLQSIVTNQQTVGIGFGSPASSSGFSGCIVDFGTTTGVPASPEANSIPYSGGQQFSTTAVVTVPANNDTAVAPNFGPAGETPSPAPDLTLSSLGRPIMVMVNGQDSEILTVQTFALHDAGGTTVPARILVSTAAKTGSTAAAVADPNADYLASKAAFLLPLATLSPNTTYTVSFSGQRVDGSVSTAVTKTWSFTTAAATVTNRQVVPAPAQAVVPAPR